MSEWGREDVNKELAISWRFLGMRITANSRKCVVVVGRLQTPTVSL
jgi:hypothetical protein